MKPVYSSVTNYTEITINRMLRSLNDMQRVIQDSSHFLLTSDKSQYKLPDQHAPPLKFVCTLSFPVLKHFDIDKR